MLDIDFITVKCPDCGKDIKVKNPFKRQVEKVTANEHEIILTFFDMHLNLDKDGCVEVCGNKYKVLYHMDFEYDGNVHRFVARLQPVYTQCETNK